jgi:hypothetical protein
MTWSPWTPSTSASPEGIGPVWQLTAVDTATRYAIGKLVAGDESARDAAGFVDHVAERLAGIGAELGGVLTDNGPEFTGRAFTSHLGDLGVDTIASRPAHPTTTPSASASRAPRSRSSTGPPSTASTFSVWPTSTSSSRAGCSTTTPGVATTATSCAAVRPMRSWRRTYHDQAKGPPVTTTRAQEALALHAGTEARRRLRQSYQPRTTSKVVSMASLNRRLRVAVASSMAQPGGAESFMPGGATTSMRRPGARTSTWGSAVSR